MEFTIELDDAMLEKQVREAVTRTVISTIDKQVRLQLAERINVIDLAVKRFIDSRPEQIESAMNNAIARALQDRADQKLAENDPDY